VKEFCCKHRSLDELCRWKATELRLFILYTVLQPKYYDHFLLLHVAIRILVDDRCCKLNATLAEKLLQRFVGQFPDCYSQYSVGYNVHHLLHLAEDSRLFGSIEKCSGFRFEN
jgi:hypothetical protein